MHFLIELFCLLWPAKAGKCTICYTRISAAAATPTTCVKHQQQQLLLPKGKIRLLCYIHEIKGFKSLSKFAIYLYIFFFLEYCKLV